MSESDSESDYETDYESDYEREFEIIHEMFPDAKFRISIDLEDINAVVSNKEQIVIQCNPCNILCDTFINRKYFIVKNNGNGITNKQMIQTMIDGGFDSKCDHQFLEVFHELNDITFLATFGS